MLSSTQQIETYRRDGYLVIPRLIEGEQLAELRALTDRIVGEARGVSANDDLYDLEPSHSPALPRVRRLKPALFKRYEFFRALTRDPKITSILAALLGPNISPPGRQAQHEVGGLRLAGRMAPGLGVLSPHQRGCAGDRHLSRRLRSRQRPADGRARLASRTDLRSPCRRPLLRGDEPPRLRHRSRQGRAADGAGRLDDHPPRPPGPRLVAQPLQPPAPAAAARIHGGRRLAAAGCRRFRRLQRSHGAGRAQRRAAPRARSGAHAVSGRRPPGLDLREPARRQPALLRDFHEERSVAR